MMGQTLTALKFSDIPYKERAFIFEMFKSSICGALLWSFIPLMESKTPNSAIGKGRL